MYPYLIYKGPVSILGPSFPGMGIPMLKVRWSHDSLIFSMGILILVKRCLYWDGPLLLAPKYSHHQFSPLTAISTDRYCYYSMHLAICLFILPTVGSSQNLCYSNSKNFRHWPYIQWGDAEYHEADHYLKNPYWTNLLHLPPNCDWFGLALRNDITTHNYLRISGIGLKFGGLMHSTTKQTAINEMTMLSQILCIP